MIDEHFDTPEPIRLFVRLPIAELHVSTVDGTESTVTVTGSARMLDATKLVLAGDRLAIAMHRKPFGGFSQHFNGAELKVHARIPHGSRVDVVTGSGDAALDGAFNTIEVRSASGDIRVAGDIAGDATVKTVSGDARLPNVAGDLVAQSVSGAVTVDEVGGSASVKSVSGDLRIGCVHAGSVKVQSVSGDVEVGIAPGTNLDVDAASASGQLTSEVPLTDKPGTGRGPTVVIRGKTVSGDVRLFRAA